jgi:hypothetical protein
MDQNQVIRQITEVKNRHETELLERANVVGVGVGYKEIKHELTDQLALIVSVTEKQALSELAVEDVVPAELNGVLTDVQEVGQLKAF